MIAKLYVCTDSDHCGNPDDASWHWVWAEDESQARTFADNLWRRCYGSDGSIPISVTVVDGFSRIESPIPCEETDMDMIRAAGGHNADDDECESCGEWSDDVCWSCNLCPQCAMDATTDDGEVCDVCLEGANDG